VKYAAYGSNLHPVRLVDWYREFVPARARFHNFPDDYVGRIASVRAVPDPDTERSARQWALAERIRTDS
jgi:hypothetical protein